MLNVTVLVSGGGTNLQALLDAQARGEIKDGRIHCVISSKPDAYALQRAHHAGIDTEVIIRKEYATAEEYDKALVCLLKKHDTDLIVLAGENTWWNPIPTVLSMCIQLLSLLFAEKGIMDYMYTGLHWMQESK